MSTIEENKKYILLDSIKQIDNDLISLLHNIEHNETVPNEAWTYLDEEIGKILHQINELREEIIWS